MRFYTRSYSSRILDTEVVAQIEHRDCDAFVEIEVEQTGGAAQQTIPMLEIVLTGASILNLELKTKENANADLVAIFAAWITITGTFR